MRLIDADNAIHAFGVFSDMKHGNKHFLNGINSAKEIINECVTIDAVPVVRGEWEVAIGYDPNKKVQCQNCYKMAYEPTPYCPYCGAHMIGGEDDG